MPIFDLLNPDDIRENYKKQIQRTIESYSIAHIVVAEAIQNSLDAMAVKENLRSPKLDILIDFDSSEVTVTDNGIGFPNNKNLLVLGGSEKKSSSRRVSGMVGVGIKVVLYCTENFVIQSHDNQGKWKLEIPGGHKYIDDNTEIEIDSVFPEDMESPLPDTGTIIKYRFPNRKNNKWMLKKFMDHVKTMMVNEDIGEDKGFIKTIKECYKDESAVHLVKSYLNRFTYLGDTLEPLGGREGLANTEVSLTIKCNDREALGEFWVDKWGESELTVDFKPNYLNVEETVKFKSIKAPHVYKEKLGNGGNNLLLTASGFNVTKYTDKEEYLLLLRDAKGLLPEGNERYDNLFNKTNCITVTIGRIPDFERFLPNGSRRVLSANGVVTGHDIDISSGRNQQYVRCIDIVFDLDAELNYGKVHITNTYLVNATRQFINDAYRRTLQTAAGTFVGKITVPPDDREKDKFWHRDSLIVDDLPIKKIPSDENDVISIFSALLGSGKIEGYSIYGFSQYDTYDARMIAKRECDRDDLLDIPKEEELRVVEFKLHASQIIRDFLSQVKNISDIHLLIAWDIGPGFPKGGYNIIEIEHSLYYQESPKKVFPAVTHYVHDSRTNKELQVLILSEYLGCNLPFKDQQTAPIERDLTSIKKDMMDIFEPIKNELLKLEIEWNYMMRKVGISTPFGRADITVRETEPNLYMILRQNCDFNELQSQSSFDWKEGETAKLAIAKITVDELLEFLRCN